MRHRLLVACSGALWITGVISAGDAQALELSQSELAIMTNDPVVPATGTLELLGIFTELPPGSQGVSGGNLPPGHLALLVRATLTAGEVLSIGGTVSGGQVGISFCCVAGTGYTPASDRIPAGDDFGPNIWEWFFNEFADPPGFLVPSQTAVLWVGFTQLEPGDEIEFFAIGPNGPPCPGGVCPSLGTVTVQAEAVPALGPFGQAALVAGLCASVIAAAARRRPGTSSPGGSTCAPVLDRELGDQIAGRVTAQKMGATRSAVNRSRSSN